MKLTRSSVLPAAGIALVAGLFVWAWFTTARHQSNPVHMGYAVQQMPDGMGNGAMPTAATHMDEKDMARMHETMLEDGAPMPQMPMTATHMRHMDSMGMGSMGMGTADEAKPGHSQHHGRGR